MTYTNLFFDLDDTLYPSSSGLWSIIRDRMSLYMIEVMRLPQDQVPGMRQTYYETYGTTLRGLQIHHQVNVDEFLAYVHDVPLRHHIRPLPGLREMLSGLPQKLWIFTNADASHALRVLNTLEISECFSGIIDIYAFGFNCKPAPGAYQAALDRSGEEDSRRCIVLDDVPKNLAMAKQLGFCTILVGSNGNRSSIADYTLSDLLKLPETLPELWETG